MTVSVKKRDGREEPWDPAKVCAAVEKAVVAVGHAAGDVTSQRVVDAVSLALRGVEVVAVDTIHDEVEKALMGLDPEAARAYIIYRDHHKWLDMDLSDGLASYVFASKYAKYENGRRETFEQAVTRLLNMHLYRWPQHEKLIRDAFEFVYAKEVMPSMRSLQFGGRAIEENNCRMYNCSFTHFDRVEAFDEIFYLLLCGCGVGFSVQPQHVARLPEFAGQNEKVVVHFTVPDTIEGWAQACWQLINSMHAGTYVEFDYSQIRPEGEPLLVSGGRAPGHLPLKRALERIREMDLRGRVRPIECYDAVCHLAEAVLSGGIRRSSLICLFGQHDYEMMFCKTPKEYQWNGKNSQRAMSNNSVVLTRDCGRDMFEHVLHVNRTNPCGEPGFLFTDDPEWGTNPCGEIGLNPGPRAFQFCNLTEVLATAKDLVKAVEAAAVIGTLQAAYTNFKYLGPRTCEVTERDALLGVSLTGIMDSKRVLQDDGLKEMLRKVAVETNSCVADLIGVNRARDVTCVKPSGTASLVLGAVGSGVHPHHAKRYFRRVTANKNEAPARHLHATNPHLFQTKPNGDWSITFPVATEGVTLDDLDAIAFLHHVRRVRECWVTGRHNVSCTVAFEPGEWPAIVEYVWAHRDAFAALSFIPRGSDKVIPFMPRERRLEADEGRWVDLVRNYRPVDWSAITEHGDETLAGGCEGPSCELREAIDVDGDS